MRVLSWMFLLLGLSIVRTSASDAPRIVSMTPNVTEIILALGATNSLAGISDYCDLPAGMVLPKCGGLLNPNFERILALQPNLLFVLGRVDRVHRFAESHRIDCHSVTIDSFHELQDEIRKIGRLIGKDPASKQLTENLQMRLDAVRKRCARLPRYKCLLLLGGESGGTRSPMAAGKNSYISEMMETAHGDNLFFEQTQPYFIPSRETVLTLQPDAIFEFCSKKSTTPPEDWFTRASTPATRNHRVFQVHEDFVMIPGPRMVEIAEMFEKYIQQFAREDTAKP